MHIYDDAIKDIWHNLAPLCKDIDVIPPKKALGSVYVVYDPKPGKVMELYKYFKGKHGFKKWQMSKAPFKTIVKGTHVTFKPKELNKVKGKKNGKKETGTDQGLWAFDAKGTKKS